MQNKKAALQLSINFIVIIIISVIILVASILIIKNIVFGAGEVKQEIDKETEEQIISMLASGQKVALPFSIKTLHVGESHVFGLGILNIFDDKKEFNINISVATAYNDTGEIAGGNKFLKEFIYPNSVSIDEDEQKIIPIFVKVPAVNKGTYIFNVNVTTNEKQYGLKKIRITVE